MKKKPSHETQLRTVKRELREARYLYRTADADRDQWRRRARLAEAEVHEWKNRHDNLVTALNKVFPTIKR